MAHQLTTNKYICTFANLIIICFQSKHEEFLSNVSLIL
jgi:hypothetical protein